jgi:hypothetical protein
MKTYQANLYQKICRILCLTEEEEETEAGQQ